MAPAPLFSVTDLSLCVLSPIFFTLVYCLLYGLFQHNQHRRASAIIRSGINDKSKLIKLQEKERSEKGSDGTWRNFTDFFLLKAYMENARGSVNDFIFHYTKC